MVLYLQECSLDIWHRCDYWYISIPPYSPLHSQSLHAWGKSLCTFILHIIIHCTLQKNFLGLGLLAGGYTVIGTLMYWFFNNMLDVIQEYWQYLLGYVVTAGLLTFGAMYYWGGVTNPRAHNLIQWTLQLVACLGLYMASRLTETSLTMLALVLMTYVTPMRYV